MDVWAEGPSERPFRTPNWGAFDSAGTYYLTDSGGWGTHDGLVWRIRPGAAPEVWTEELRAFPNGLCLSADGSTLYILESYPGALVEVPILPDGSAGARRLLCDLDPAVPDGVALTDDGGFLIACYRPDAVLRWHPDDGLSTYVEDVRGTVLAAPTNIAFVGDHLEFAVVPNIGRWHLTRIPLPARGIPPFYPDIP
jgi:gluconolactonase